MKAKYYRIKKQLNSHEAGVYLKKLTCVDLSEREFYGLMGDNLPIYLRMSDGRALDGSIDDVSLTLTPDGLQKICSHHHLFGCDGLIAGFYLPKSTSDKQNATYVDLQGAIYSNDVVAPKGKSVAWQAKYGDLHGSLVFLSSDIEALAAKMNNQPDTQALQIENQRLQQEIETLRAEVERLKADNDDLYGANKSLMLEQGEKAYISEVDAVPRLNHGLAFTYPTQLLKLVADVQQKFYAPDRFDINEPDSYPRKSKITEWLAKNPQLSKADIDRIERVATPFDRTPTSKKANH